MEDSHQGALVRKVVEVLWEPSNFQDDRPKRVGVCFPGLEGSSFSLAFAPAWGTPPHRPAATSQS